MQTWAQVLMLKIIPSAAYWQAYHATRCLQTASHWDLKTSSGFLLIAFFCLLSNAKVQIYNGSALLGSFISASFNRLSENIYSISTETTDGVRSTPYNASHYGVYFDTSGTNYNNKAETP